jgi:non-lysosomal glucosylceramidase
MSEKLSAMSPAESGWWISRGAGKKPFGGNENSNSEERMMRKCNCSGHCGPTTDGLSRREFLELAAAGTAGALLVGNAPGASFDLPADEFEKWKRELFAPAKPRLYLSDKHRDARMHLGGLGTGNFEIGADGQLNTWQLFNTLRDGHVALHFAIKAGETARLLQTAGGPSWPRVNQIEMTGEYPVARLRFNDPALPVQLEMEAFSPFAPLDTRLSSVPLAAFVFRVKNPTAQAQTISLGAFMQNPVGYDARGNNDWAMGLHPSFGGNVNEPFQQGRALGLAMRANPASEPKLDKAVSILAGANLKGLKSPPADTPANLNVSVLDRAPTPADLKGAPESAVMWLEEPAADLSETLLRGLRERVQEGATLLLAGRTMPLLRSYAAASGGKPLAQTTARPAILFEDFERAYEKWKVTGEAFGQQPARGTLPNQQRVSGFIGRGLVNTFLNGDDATGRLTSQPFTVERHFIRFLVGGGSQATTQIRLVVGGKTARATAGKDNERLEPAIWDVREFEGQTAQIEIVDEQKGPWGHINVDQIEFADEAGNGAVLALLEEILPARFSAIRELAAQPGGPYRVSFEGQELRPDAKPATAKNGLELLVRSFGKGKVVLAAGQVLDPASADHTNARQRAYQVVCALVGGDYIASEGQPAKGAGFGTLALAALAGESTVQVAFDDWQKAWQRFTADGHFADLEKAKASPPTPGGRTVNGAVATNLVLPPGSTVEVPFLLAWHYPNKYNNGGTWMGCHYATEWAEARAVMQEATAKFEEWRAKTNAFRQALYDSTLPYWLLDCLTANAAIIRHIGVVFRIANGDIYGWEGSNGCCQPTCTHVWGYEQTLARLFPDMEREMRRIDFKHQQRADGGVNNRTDVPSPARPTGEQPFADGHASCILKAYREALNSPDESFFKEYWPGIRRAVEYLIGRDAKSHGGQPAGYLADDQWNTYDEALHGVTTFISGYYLAALRAGEEWARRLGDGATADRFHGVFEKGQQQLVELCWNGEYFQQNLPGYEQRQGEVGPGCMADQLIGQWWAHQLGLGYILPKEKVVAALRSVFKYNFKSDLTGWRHSPRAFAGAKDKGLIICTWPKGGRPRGVMLYSDEVWTGIEYQVAAHLIYEGLVEEGFAVVKAARDRYDGLPRPPIGRNPWNEIECGGHYARAMSSWSLLLALSGWEHDGPRQALRVGPRHTPDNFKGFWCGPEGWGVLTHKVVVGTLKADLAVKSGRLPVKTLTLALVGNIKPAKVTATLAGKTCAAQLAVNQGKAEVKLEAGPVIHEGETLEITLA